MRKFFKFLGTLILLLILFLGGYYFVNNEDLPVGKQGKEADELATKMLQALNYESYKNTEVLIWNFRNSHFYKWRKQEGIVTVSWGDVKVNLNTNQPEKSTIITKKEGDNSAELIKKAAGFFNNDSFWLVAPYKVFDAGTERSIVTKNGQNSLLITYTSGGSTPGDSYLWKLNENYIPISYKMWAKIIPIGGISASWNHWKNTASGIKLSTKHDIALPLFGASLEMGAVEAYNPKADDLAAKILKAVHHEAYKKTRFLTWSFGGKRQYKWDKEKHIVDVLWDSIRVNLHPNSIEKSTVFFNEKQQKTTETTIVEKAEKYFNNDSFWLVAPHKLFENGIVRNIKKVADKDALLVKYTVGGTTPGDSYLWILDKNNLPISYKMNVPSMKMEEVPATWDDWITTESGTMLPTNHTFSSGNKLSMGIVKGYN